MSGKGLGFTGGTADKLEAIEGYKINIPRDEFIEQVNKIGISLISQSGNLTPADKKIYSLRDVTATIDSIPLIASSIMSKKIAAGADCIVLDVKMGSRSFYEKFGNSKRII
jgi:pyrimidine-nucleoside phosphorylase